MSNTFDIKFGTVVQSFVMLQKKMLEKICQNWSYKDDDVTNYVIFFLKKYAKNALDMFFL